MNPFTSQRLKYVADVRFSNVDKLSEPDEIPVRLCNYTDVYKNERITHDMPFMEATASAAEIRRFGLHVDDVIFTKDSESPTDIAVPAVVASTAPDLVCGYHLAIARPHTARLSGRFLLRALQATGVREQFYMQANGVTRFGLSQAAIGNVRVPVPPLNEQARIADFLDRKTASIDTLIEKQEQLLALLAEKRQALITQAVTKGLDPNVAMKDSGVVTLGRIPAHWHLTKLRRVGRVGQGDAFPHDLQGQGEGELPWFKVADMNRAGNEIEMLSADNYVSREVALAAKVTIFEPGAVIFPRVGAALLTNKRRLLTRPSIIDDNTYAVVPNNRIRSRFLYLSLLLVDMGSICSAGLVPTVTFSAIRDLDIALPPIAEQDAIIQHVEVECRRIDSLSQRVQAMIEKLREYRQALITAAVTGQLDVTSGAVATSAPKPYAEAVGT